MKKPLDSITGCGMMGLTIKQGDNMDDKSITIELVSPSNEELMEMLERMNRDDLIRMQAMIRARMNEDDDCPEVE
jgi:hypothetical protein